MPEKTDDGQAAKVRGRLEEEYGAVGNLQDVGKECTCPADCRLHGNCAACVAWHRDHARGPLPHCLRAQPGVTFQRGESLRNIESA